MYDVGDDSGVARHQVGDVTSTGPVADTAVPPMATRVRSRSRAVRMLMIVAVLLATAATATTIGLKCAARPAMALADLLPDTPPSSLGSGWEYAEPPFVPPGDSPTEALESRWTNVDTDIFVSERVYDESNVIAAAYIFWGDNPERHYRSSFEDATRRSASVGGLAADSHIIFCGNVGNSVDAVQFEACSQWVFWARYGQYLFQVVVRGLSTGADGFHPYVRAIDADIHTRLGTSC